MRRYVVLTASILIQTCLGGLYAWSAFVPELKSGYGLSSTQTGLIFGAAVAVFTLAMVIAGQLLEKWGPRLIAGIGGILFGAGYLLASFSAGNFLHLFLGLGVLVGCGIGFGYVCPLSICVKWFPEKKGFVTGLAVAGFGGGAVILSELADLLFIRGMDVLGIFWWVGLSYGGVILLSALFLSVPPKSAQGHHTKPKDPILKLLKEGEFWSLILGMFAGTFGGLLVIGNLKPIGIAANVPVHLATLAISLFAVGNASGRILWGIVFDKIGRTAIPLSLLALGGGILLLLGAGSIPLYMTASFVIGFGFGSCFVLYAAEVASAYGHDHVGSIYPYVFLLYGFSGISGPVAGGYIYDHFGNYTPAILTASAIGILGAIVFVLLRKHGASTWANG